MAALIAEEMGLGVEQVELIRRAAPLHDVGKIGIPAAILTKPGSPTPAEFEVMKSHIETGTRILGEGSFPLLRMACEIVRYQPRVLGRKRPPGTASGGDPADRTDRGGRGCFRLDHALASVQKASHARGGRGAGA